MVTRWWVVLCVSVVWDNVSLQPTSENGRSSECCPCPKNTGNSAGFDDQDAAGSAVASMRAFPGVSDCPCMAREADSAGSSSMFFPSAVRAVRPFVTSDSKENPEPLLHPEVNLASSVLETLREATDEEYRDSLARDAARSAADGNLAEVARNLVTVIINPKDPMEDDVMAEASHIHEARCIDPPVARSSLSKSAYKPILLTDILHLPKRKSTSYRPRHLLDRDNGLAPSNVNERVVKPTFKSNFADFKSAPSKSNLVTDKTQSPLEKLITKLPDITSNAQKDRSSSNPTSPKIPKPMPPKFKLPNFRNTVPKLNLPSLLRNDDDDMTRTDNQGSASVLNERYTGFEKEACEVDGMTMKSSDTKEISRPNVKGLNQDSKNDKPSSLDIFKIPDFSSDFQKDRSNSNSAPTVLPKSRAKSNVVVPTIFNSSPKLTKLTWLRKDKDDLPRSESQHVETMAKSFDSIGVPDFKRSGNNLSLKPGLGNLNNVPSDRREAATDLLSNLFKGLEIPNLSNLLSSDVFKLRNNDQVKSNDQTDTYNTEILDTVPSPSEIKSDHVSFSEAECKTNFDTKINNEREEVQKILERNPIKTDIIDNVPASSDMNEVSGYNDNSISRDNNAELNNVIAEINNDNFASESDNPLDNSDFFKGVNSDVVDDVSDIPDVPQASNFVQPSNDNDERSLVDNEDKNMSLRKKLQKTLDNLKDRSKTNIINKDPINLNNDDFVFNEDQFDQNEESPRMSAEIFDPKDIPSDDQVNIDDLQQMSDSLLDQEKLRADSISEDNNLNKNAIVDAEDQRAEFFEDEDRALVDNNGFSDNSMLETSNIDTARVKQTPNNINNENYCLEDGSKGKVAQALNQEMEAEASERIINTIPSSDNLRESLRQSILEPLSLKDLKLPTLNVGDLFNINNPLPGLFKEKSSRGSFPTRNQKLEYSLPKQIISPSTNSYKSALLPLQPLEDMNLDILQLKPLSSDQQTIPRLNLNSFKSKLRIPDSLQLRPLLLESSIGNEKGVIGASMTFGKDKKGAGRSNMLRQESLKKPEILRRPIGILSNLDELRDAMYENTQNLLNTPLETTSRNVVEDTIRSGQVFTENLRVGAENAMKDIQQNLESTFEGMGFNDGLISSPSMRIPSNLFEDISRRRDDVNDKLKGIHYDLSDRLETLRNSLFDDYKLSSLRSSILPTLGSTLGSSMARQSSKKTSTYRTSSSPNKGMKINSNLEPKGKFVKGRTSTDKNKFRAAEAASTPVVKTLKSPKLKESESPILQALRKGATEKLSLPRNRPGLGILPKTEKNSIDTNTPIFKKQTLPKLGKSNVKISFSTTELPPIVKNKAKVNSVTKSKSTLNKDPFNKPIQRSKTLSAPKSASNDKSGLISKYRDSSPFASDIVTSRVKVPFKERQSVKGLPFIRSKAGTMETDSEREPSMAISSISRPKPPMLDKVYSSNLGQISPETTLKPKSPLISDGTVDKILSSPLRSSLPTAPLSWPKTIDDSFLTKVREAVKARLAGISQGLNTSPKLGGPRTTSTSLVPINGNTFERDDMARSASNNVDIVGQPMQENTSYTCKMMCTKNE